MHLPWPDDEMCPYCNRKGKVGKTDTTYELVAAANERAVLSERIRKHEARIAELEAKLKVEKARVDHLRTAPVARYEDPYSERNAELEAQLEKVRRWMADDAKWRAILASEEQP